MKSTIFLAVTALAIGVLVLGCSETESITTSNRSAVVAPTDMDNAGDGPHADGNHMSDAPDMGNMDDHGRHGMGGDQPHDGGMDGHHNDDCMGDHNHGGECLADDCPCPDHDECGGMMGGDDCDADCPGCDDHCGGMEDDDPHGGKQHDENGGHDQHGGSGYGGHEHN